MPSPVYQYVINLVVSLPNRRVPGVLMKFSMQEPGAPCNQIFWCCKIYCSFIIIITILM